MPRPARRPSGSTRPPTSGPSPCSPTEMRQRWCSSPVLTAPPSPRPIAPDQELADLGLTNQRLVINGVLTDPRDGDAIAESYARRQEYALAHLPVKLAGRPASVVPLVGVDLVGVDVLRGLARGESSPRTLRPKAHKFRLHLR